MLRLPKTVPTTLFNSILLEYKYFRGFKVHEFVEEVFLSREYGKVLVHNEFQNNQ